MVKLISITKNAENIIAYCARVSNPENQTNVETAPKLLSYLIRKKHWSPFEQASATIEIETSRTVGRQILRHKSMSFMEFSGRYSSYDTNYPIIPTARRQDDYNRQNSWDDLPVELIEEFKAKSLQVWDMAKANYDWALSNGIAKECARMLLPEGMTKTRMYMTGNIRSWIHYLALRVDKDTQLEHQMIALNIQQILAQELPNLALALNWSQSCHH